MYFLLPRMNDKNRQVTVTFAAMVRVSTAAMVRVSTAAMVRVFTNHIYLTGSWRHEPRGGPQ
jgi:hypothetical protein